MNKKSLLILGVAGVTLLLSSCQYDNDPYADFKKEAVDSYKLFYEKHPEVEKEPLFYFDIGPLGRSALVRNENEVVYLGNMKFTDFTFSNTQNFFADLGNLPIRMNDTNNDGTPDGVQVGSFIKNDESGAVTFDPKAFMQNIPMVLREILPNGDIATYSMVTKDGEILDQSNAKAYDPNFFYISDLKLNMEGLEQFTDSLLNFEGKDVAVLRKDFYSAIADFETTAIPAQISGFFSFKDLFDGMYRKSNKLSTNDEMPQTLKISGTHYTNFKDSREVVVGPFALVKKLFSQLIPSDNPDATPTPDNETSAIHKIENIVIEEGVSTVSLYAFDGDRASDEEASKSGIKNIHLPSSLQNIQFNSFSNLDLEGLYINKTFNEDKKEKPFDFVDFGDVNLEFKFGSGVIDLNITGSFSHTKINNLYFEGYDNLNISNFPYASIINLNNPTNINKALKVYHKKGVMPDVTKFESLTEAFKAYDTINPFYQMDKITDENKKYVVKSDLETLSNNKILYIPYHEYSLNIDESRSVITNRGTTNPTGENAFITLKLDKDLVVENGGQLIIGSQIGATKDKSGTNVGSYASLDLNGHNLIVKDGGVVKGDGVIFDSKNTGKITLHERAILTTNITINDYSNFNEVSHRIENGVAPFEKYSLDSLKVNVEVSSGATIKGNIDYVGEAFYNENQIDLVSSKENAMYQLTSGKLVVNQSKISSFDNSTALTINDSTLISINDDSAFNPVIDKHGTSDFAFSFHNESFKIDVRDLTIKTKFKLSKGDSLTVSKLKLEEGAQVIAEEGSNLHINNSLEFSQNLTKNVTLSGSIGFEKTAFETFKKIIVEKDTNLDFLSTINSYQKGENESYKIVKDTYLLEGFVGESSNNYTSKIVKNSRGYYYSFNDNGNSGKLVDAKDNTLAAYENGDTEWKAYINSEVQSTNVKKEQLITSFNSTTDNYVLNIANGSTSWNKISTMNPDFTYTVNGMTYIQKYGTSELIEGTFVEGTPVEKLIFKSINTGKQYAVLKELSKWVEVEGFDNYATLKITDKDFTEIHKYIVNVGNDYVMGFDYDSTMHIATNSKTSETYAYTNENRYELFDKAGLDRTHKQVNSIDDKLIFLALSQSWARVDELHKGLCKSATGSANFYYYFLINDRWYQSVEGEIAVKYNGLADKSFGVLKEKIQFNGNKYKFVMKDGKDPETEFNLFMPQEMVKIHKKDFSDLWPEGTATDHLFAYRHITKNDGKKYLYYKDDITGKVEEKAFEFATGFKPSQPDPSNSNLLTKFNFIIYKVVFEGETQVRTIYVVTDSADSDNAIYAGNTAVSPDGQVTDDYLAIAIFSSKNPISDFANGQMPANK